VSDEKFSGWEGEKEHHQDREIAPISFLPFYQWRVKGRTEHAPRDNLTGNAAPRY